MRTAYDVINLDAACLRRLASQLGLKNWSQMDNRSIIEMLMGAAGRNPVMVPHEWLIATAPSYKIAANDPTLGAPLPTHITVVNAPPGATLTLFRSFGLDLATLTYSYPESA